MMSPTIGLTVTGIVMKKFFFCLAVATAALVPTAAAVAADLDVAPPPPPTEELRQATYDWSGAYVGGWVGVSCMDGFLTDNGAVAPANGEWEMDGCGGKGGVMAGYNHQFDSFVLGAEVDWGMTGEVARNDTPGADFAYAMDHLVTGRLKAGYAWDDTLFYATGGLAWAMGDLYGVNGAPDPDHLNESHWGWTIGGGVEHAFTDQFRLRLEYLYTHFKGADYYSTSCTVTCDVTVDDYDDHEVKVGLIWAF
jgi:outer membrane immunogenic protein